ncbi:unnamed protein product, partial [Iphiclides podalirius]
EEGCSVAGGVSAAQGVNRDKRKTARA